jgi:RhoGAP domain
MKKFLRDLPEPLLTFKLGELFIISQKLESMEDRKKAIRLLCCMVNETDEAPEIQLGSVERYIHVHV